MRLFDKLVVGLACAACWVAACGGNVVVDARSSTGTGTETDTTTQSGGTDTSSDTFSETETVGGTGTDSSVGTETASSCMSCACDVLLSEGGCADICNTMFNGSTSPNFCEGSLPLWMCAECIAMNCGSNPAQCM